MFDRISYVTLLRELYLYNIPGVALDMIRSYLRDHYQRIVMNKKPSDLRPQTAGVPLGSILGPLLFNLYINDIANSDDNILSLIIYVDDTSIFFSGADTDQIIGSTHTFSEKLNAWTGSNSLQIN